MFKISKTVVFLSAICALVFAQDQSFKIKYISASHIYLEGGKKNGLAVGDVLNVFRKDKEIGTIEVEYVSQHSASCKIIRQTENFVVGDVARVVKRAPAKKTEESQKAVTKRKRTFETGKRGKSVSSISKTRISGYLSLQYYRYQNIGSRDYNFSQPTVRFRLRALNLWDAGFNLEIKFRSRYNQRSRRFSDEVPKSEWQNRLYQLTFSYDKQTSFVNFKLGRVISNAISGIGYIDGAQVQFNLFPYLRWGVFAGTQPDWRTSDFQTTIQKYGSFLTYQRGQYGANRTEITMAAAGEYHGSTVSREFVYFQGSYNHGRRWNIYQNIELDLNRAWRKQRAGESISLTGVYFSARYNITQNFSTAISYDNRKNYYTYELRSLADSLFDSAFRQGLRWHFYGSIFSNYRFSLNFGVREKQSDSRFTYTYGANVTRRKFLGKYNTIQLRFSGFDNVFATGYNPTLLLSRSFINGHYLSLSYGAYRYSIKNGGSGRINQWLRLNGQFELPARFYLSSTYEYNWGDDLNGHRLLFDLGYRF